MPLYIADGLEIIFLATIFPAIAYGIVVILSGNCFYLLHKKRGIYSNRMRILLLIYVIFMLLCSTWKLLQSVCGFMILMAPVPPPGSFMLLVPLEFPLILWGADGFMVWRCLVLYQDISRGPRIVIIVLLSLISFAYFVCGVAVLVYDSDSRDPLVHKLYYSSTVLISLSTLVNIVLAALIVGRLVYHRRYVQNALGVEHGSPYTNVITMCVESSALMVIFGGLYTILHFASPGVGKTVAVMLVPHIYVISPLLIVYRVAIGRAKPPTSLPSEQAMGQILFNTPVSNPSSQEGEV